MHEPTHPRARRRGGVVVLAVLACVGLLAVACGSGKSSSSSSTQPATQDQSRLPDDSATPTDGGTLVWGLEAETDSMSPSSGRWAVSGHMVASAVFDPLVTLDADGKTVPYLAESMTPNADNTQWMVKVRSGISFHDGEPLNATAVKMNLDADKASIITGKAMNWVSSIDVVDDLTVKVTVTQPWATFPSLFTGQIGYIAAPRQINNFYGGDAPIGTGPFVFKEWVKGDHFTATKNPSYWQQGLPHLDAIEFRPVPDATQRLDELQNGTLDAIDTLTPASIDQLRTDATLNHLEYDRGEASFAVLNTQNPPFDNQNARSALAYATDQAAYINEVAPGVYQPTNGVYAQGHLGYLADSGYPAFDLDKAKTFVQQYTAETGKPLEFTYVGASNIDDQQRQQILKGMWEAAGMKVNLQSVKQDDQIITVVLGQYQAADFRLFNQPDPDNDWVWLSSTTVGQGADISLNMPRYGTAAIDAGLNGGRSTTDEDTRRTDYENVNREINAAQPYIWLARVDWTIGAQPRVHGYADAANGSIQTLGPKTWVAKLWLGS